MLAALDWISLTKRLIKGEAERVSKSSSSMPRTTSVFFESCGMATGVKRFAPA